MADTSTATVTGVTGPGKALTAKVFQRVAGADFNFQNNVLRINFVDANKGPLEVDIAADTTFTLTVTAGVYALTVT